MMEQVELNIEGELQGLWTVYSKLSINAYLYYAVYNISFAIELLIKSKKIVKFPGRSKGCFPVCVLKLS